MIPLSKDFYLQNDVVTLAKELIGKTLLTEIDGKLTGGMIIETEAYKGAEDKASHAYKNRRTKRTEVIFATGGVAYIYLCYGMHNLLNVVTGEKDTPHAILIRGLVPLVGMEEMQKRRNGKKKLTNGPGTVCQALGIDRRHNGHPLTEIPLWIEEGEKIPSKHIIATPRIGIDYAEDHSLLPWRFLLQRKPKGSI